MATFCAILPPRCPLPDSAHIIERPDYRARLADDHISGDWTHVICGIIVVPIPGIMAVVAVITHGEILILTQLIFRIVIRKVREEKI